MFSIDHSKQFFILDKNYMIFFIPYYIFVIFLLQYIK